MTAPPDRAARARTVEDRGRSLLVQASAGTGKTHAIIDVILEVCVRRKPRLSLGRIAAVTFTEKAAGELQSRLRDRLAELAQDGSETAPAARESLEEIDRAQVGTIHAFCASLLRERPIEAGLVPGFSTLLPEASAALASLVWEDWWRAEVAERPDGPVGRALRSGIKLVGGGKEATLTKLAADLYDKRAQIDGAILPAADARPVLAEAARLADRAKELERRASDEGNPAAGALGEIARWLTSLPDELPAIRAASGSAPSFKFKPRWKDEEIARFRDKEYKRHFLERLPDTEHWPMLVDLLRRLAGEPGGYLDAVQRRKKRESLLDFDDILLGARELLRGSAPARAHFRDRYALLIVDEFQDTDPIQMEILLRLAHADGGGPEWWNLSPEDGRLLVVGDPKQSIYRFRRADLETYAAVANVLGTRREVFVANRRSVPPVLAWVNAVFSRAMAPPVRAFEAPYSPVEPWGVRSSPAERRVVYLEPPAGWRADDESWRASEAQAIASFVAEAVGSGRLPVGDEGRPARAGDVCVLVRANEGIGLLQEAITARGLEAVTEGGVDFFRREEPAAVLAALRAVDNPDDRVALYAALKSFLFAFSDEELFLAREGGAEFDLRRAERASGELRDALELFARLRAARDERPASETLLDLYAATDALVKARARRVGGLQAQANLVHLASLAREIEGTASSFAAVVAGVSGVESTDFSEPRAFEESRDAVRILTVHRAKGLEFPVVVASGFGSTGRSGADGLLVPTRDGPWGASLKRGGDTVSSPGFEALRRADEERDRAELRRLLYVAATRAEDWLVVSRWRKITEGKDGPVDAFDRSGLALLGPLELSDDLDRLVDRRESPSPPRSRRRGSSRPDPEAAAELRREIDRIAARPQLLAGIRSAALRRAGGTHAADEDRPAEERSPSAEPSIAARIGCAVHDAMETIVQGVDPALAVARAASEWELGSKKREEVASMVETLRRATFFAAGGRRIAEFPVLFRSPDDGALVEGKIDLLLEGPDGWTIVDYKTDRLDRLRGKAGAREHFEAYRPQLREYATALRLLGVPVARACVVSARSGEVFDLL